MSKSGAEYIPLCKIDHKMQYSNIIGIIDDISPVIRKKTKVLGNVVVEICDATLHRPGFLITIFLESKVLDQFLEVAKRGLIIEFLYIKLVKNDGVVYGEVRDEEEVNLYADDGLTNLTWWHKGKNFHIGDKVKCAINELNRWKLLNFNESSEVLPEQMSSLKRKLNDSFNNSRLHLKASDLASPRSTRKNSTILPKTTEQLKRSTRTSLNSQHLSMSEESSKKTTQNNQVTQKTTNKNQSITDKKVNKAVVHNISSSKISSPKKTLFNSLRNKKSFEKDQTTDSDSSITLDKYIVSESNTSGSMDDSYEEHKKPKRRKITYDNAKSAIAKNNSFKDKLGDKVTRSTMQRSQSLSNLSYLRLSTRQPNTPLSINKMQTRKINVTEKTQCVKKEQNKTSLTSKSSIHKLSGKLEERVTRTTINRSKSLTNLPSESSTSSSDQSHMSLRTKKLEPYKTNVAKKSWNASKDNNSTLKNSKKVTNSNNLFPTHLKTESLTTTNEKTTDKKNSPKKLTRASSTSHIGPTIPSKAKDMVNRLAEFTKQLDIVYVDELSEISVCEIEEIDVPDKIDLLCKVLSFFTLIEEQILVVRVQDGTICKKPTLCITKQDTWDDIVASLLRGPVVRANSPWIDIIIFDYPRMDTTIVSGKYYEFHNIMAIKLQLKKDPRDKPNKNELFFCAKGPDTYVKSRGNSSQTMKDIESLLNEDSFKELCSSFGSNVTNATSGVLSPNKAPSAVKQPIESHVKNDSIQKSSPNTRENPVNKKRKLCDIGCNTEDAPLNKKMGVEINSATSGENSSSEQRKDHNKSKIDALPSSDETMINESECLIDRELTKITNEETELGLPPRVTTEMHLQNSSSEVTYSQFCRGAKDKSPNFKTSTQESELSVNFEPVENKEGNVSLECNVKTANCLLNGFQPLIDKSSNSGNKYGTNIQNENSLDVKIPVLKDKGLQLSPERTNSVQAIDLSKNVSSIKEKVQRLSEESDKIELPCCTDSASSVEAHNLSRNASPTKEKAHRLSAESDKMEPLVYCPSNSSLSSCRQSGSPELQELKECSESILQRYKPLAPTEAVGDPTCSHASVALINIPSGGQISPSSSDLLIVYANNNITKSNMSTPTTRINQNNTLIVQHSPHTPNSIRMSSFENKRASSNVNYDHVLRQESNDDSIIEIEETNLEHPQSFDDSNSSNDSFFSYSNIPFVAHRKNSPIPLSLVDHFQDDDKAKHIPNFIFYQSSKKPHLPPQAMNNTTDTIRGTERFGSRSLQSDLPFVTFDTISKLRNYNYLTVPVIIVKVTPSLSGPWQEECIKSKCPECNMTFKSYNALNNRFVSKDDALAVGSHIVCPHSQCCNKVLEPPKFHFSVNCNLKTGKQLNAEISGKYAEDLFGCTAYEAARDETILAKVKRVLQQVTNVMSQRQPIRVDFTRTDICNPKSGPLYIQKFHFK